MPLSEIKEFSRRDEDPHQIQRSHQESRKGIGKKIIKSFHVIPKQYSMVGLTTVTRNIKLCLEDRQ